MDEKRFVRILWIAKISLLAVLLYAGFQVATSRLHVGAFLDPSAAAGDPRTTEEPAPAPEAPTPADYTAMARRNLFRSPDDTAAPRAGANPPESLDSLASAEELGLRLVGAVAGVPTASRALIQDTKSNATGVYRIGDTVASATIETIQREVVVLRHNGTALALKLRSGTAAGTKSSPDTDKPKGGTAPAAGVPKPSKAARPDRAAYVAEVFHNATLEPYVRNDRTEGLRITGLEEFPMAEKLGLKNGDVIQTVNGQQLTTKQKAFQVLMKAKTQSRVNIQLLRDGKSKGLAFDL